MKTHQDVVAKVILSGIWTRLLLTSTFYGVLGCQLDGLAVN